MRDTNHIVMTEREALGLLIHYYDLTSTRISKDDFRHPIAQVLCEAIKTLNENGEVITETTLFREASKIHYETTPGLIKELLTLEVHEESTEAVLRHLHTIKMRTIAEEQGEKLIQLSQSSKAFDIEKATRIAFDVQETIKDYEEPQNTADRFHAILVDGLTNPQKARTRTGDKFLDNPETGLYDGFSPGQLILIAGATSQGKSTYALHLASSQVNIGEPVLYFNSELSERSIAERFISMRTGVKHTHWRLCPDTEKENLLKLVELEYQKLDGKPFELVSIEEGANTLERIRTNIRDFKRLHKVDHATVYIDLVTMLRECSGDSDSRANAIEAAVDRLNGIAKAENVCIVMVAQMNRKADEEKVHKVKEIGDKLRPTISTIKASSALAERSRVVLSVFRQKPYADRTCRDDPDYAYLTDDIMEIQILKQSEGMIGGFGYYMFNGGTFELTPVEKSKIISN